MNYPLCSLETYEGCGTFGCQISPGALAAILSSVVVVLLIPLLVFGWLLRQHKEKVEATQSSVGHVFLLDRLFIAFVILQFRYIWYT